MPPDTEAPAPGGVAAPPAPVQPGRTRPAESPDVAPSAPRPPDRRAGRRRLSNLRESMLLFAFLYAVYGYIGYHVVVDQHVVVLDGLSRLAHAYFAWHNDPPKLAAIGFEWPPMMTLVFLPLAGIKSLATSFAALPLTSAFFGAGLVVVLSRILSTFGMRPALRYPLVLLFAANPMIVFYATNGMAESVYLFFFVVAIYFLLRWYRNGHSHVLGVAGGAMALAALARYEMGAFALVVGLGVLLILAQRRASRQEISGSLTLYAAPVAYGLAGWCFFNWLIIGNPLFWIERQAQTNVTVGRGVASQASAGGIPLGEIADKLLALNAQLFPLILLVVPALLIVFFLRRDSMSLILAALASLNAAMTAAFLVSSHDESLLQLRYNMRAMPMALIGAGWLFWLYRGRAVRASIYVLTAAALAISLPLTWHTMDSYPYQFGEQAFVRALSTGGNRQGTTSIGGYRIGVAADRQMADYVLAHVTQPNSILTDDAQTFSVMLASGRPDLFLDRIDKGDRPWHRMLADPYGRVGYILVSRFGQPDQVHECYPRILRGEVPGTRVAFGNSLFVLVSVVRRAPPAVAGRRFPADCPIGSG